MEITNRRFVMAREITEQDLANKGVAGLPDVPGLTTEAMQKKFD